MDVIKTKIQLRNRLSYSNYYKKFIYIDYNSRSVFIKNIFISFDTINSNDEIGNIASSLMLKFRELGYIINSNNITINNLKHYKLKHDYSSKNIILLTSEGGLRFFNSINEIGTKHFEEALEIRARSIFNYLIDMIYDI